MTVETLSHNETAIRFCPAVVTVGEGDYRQCGKELKVVATTEVVGDNYGDWKNYYVSFDCGHSLTDMQSSIEAWEEGWI